jgi:hypothetical protein
VSNRDELLKSHEAGNFLETVHAKSLADYNNHSALALELVALHNEGLIDIIETFESTKSNSSNGPEFFLTRHIFEKALPNLEAPVIPVMKCVIRLYRDAGQDLIASTIIESFSDFCTKESTRPLEALKEIEANPDAFAVLLPAALAAGSRIDYPFYLAKAIRLCEDKDIGLRRCAVFSIGRLNWPDGVIVPNSALLALKRSAETETDDHILANIVKSAFALLQREKTQEPLTVTLIARALSKGDEYTLHVASQIFAFHAGELPTSIIEAIFANLARVKPANIQGFRSFDSGIYHLLKKDHLEKALQVLEDLLLTFPNELTMQSFQCVASEILDNQALFSKVLTRWFLRGDRVLCDGVYTIVSMYHGDNLPLEIDPTELKRADFIHILFVARKAIGYLFMQPISATTILLSLMRHTTHDKALMELGRLLVNPLLLNFPGKVRDYIVQQSGLEAGKVKETIDKALKDVDAYLDDLRSVSNLVALHPGEAQREAYHRHFSCLMAESYKAAEAQSFLQNLFSKSILLYGRKSINYVYGPDGQLHRMEMPLQSHCIGMEFPRMENIDPLGLDYMLRIFRNERLRA